MTYSGELTRRSFLVGAVALAVSAQNAAAQSPAWRQILPVSEIPLPRWDHNLAASDTHLLLFGGRDSNGNALGDTWLFDLESSAWTPVDSAGPSPRFGNAAAVDADNEQFWLFAGQAGSNFYNDTWQFDFATGLWAMVSDGSIGAPSPRYGLGAAMAGQQFVISHGFTFEGRFDDTWQFDPASSAWTNITPSGVRPLNRCLHELIDSGSGILLYGGCSSGFGPCPQGDTWSLDSQAGVWSEITPATGPPARSNPSVVWSETAGGAVLFGGQTELGKSNDLWIGAIGDAGFAWSSLTGSGEAPAPRSSHDAVVVGRTMYLFGGLTDAGATSELWALDF